MAGPFPYNPNIPAAPDYPGNDQPGMLQNAGSINSWTAVDHFPFNAGNAGSHKQVTLTNQAAPGLGAGGNGVLYANTQAGNSWPFWQNALGSTQLIGGISSVSTTGYVYLPGGLIMQWGQFALAKNQQQGTITFPLNPFPNAVFVATFTPTKDGTDDRQIAIQTGSLSTSGFVFNINGNGPVGNFIYWIALGN